MDIYRLGYSFFVSQLPPLFFLADDMKRSVVCWREASEIGEKHQSIIQLMLIWYQMLTPKVGFYRADVTDRPSPSQLD